MNQLCSKGNAAAATTTTNPNEASSLIAQLLQHSNICREELVRIVIDLFLAAADTVSMRNRRRRRQRLLLRALPIHLLNAIVIEGSD